MLTLLKLIVKLIKNTGWWVFQIVTSAIVLSLLIFIVVNFYIFSSIVNLNAFFYAFLILSLLTDGLFILLHLPRKRKARKIETSFSPEKLTIVIACHNGEKVIKETIQNAAKHVPLNQIIVVSDASTDKTASVAHATGANVIVSKKHLHKVGSINAAMEHVTTPYVLILDDDTLIGKTKIPTSLLDEGYTAVAFNVMPVPERTLINELQTFEYRSTMQMSKHLRSKTGAIGNVSGAIGLYRSEDLRRQITLHSGQFAGEDEQRTLLAHMYGTGKGVTYTDSLVLTKAPAKYKDLFRQRAFSWSISSPELFVLYWKTILSPRFHYLLKAEKAYLVYIYMTEPLRMLFVWTLFLKPRHAAIAYAFYLCLNLIIWARFGFSDTLRSVVLTPVYNLGLTICRFIGYFYWVVVKTRYLVNRMHVHVVDRKLLAEYALTFVMVAGSWVVSIQHYKNEMHLFNKLRTEALSSDEGAFNYDSLTTTAATLTSTPSKVGQTSVVVDQGDTARAVAHKAVDKYLLEHPEVVIDEGQRWKVDMALAGRIPDTILDQAGVTVQIAITYIEQAISEQAVKEVQL